MLYLLSPVVRMFRMRKWQMRFAFWRSTRSRRRSRVIRACRWAWPTSPRCCFRASSNSIPADPAWPDRDRFVLVRRSRLDAAVCAVVPDGLRGRDIGRTQGIQAVGIEDAWSSRIWPYAGRGDHHRTAGAGHCDGGRHGAGRAPVERALRRRFRRSLYLCDRRRRLPDGRPQPRGDFAGRASAAQPADRAVRRQPDFDRRVDIAVVFG